MSQSRESEPSTSDLQPPTSTSGGVALLIIDMQNAFFEDPTLGPLQHGLVRACNTLIDAAAVAGTPVLAARTVHLRDRSTWTRSMLDDDQGFIFEGTRQSDFVDGIHLAGVETVTKTRDSAFFGTDLAVRLRRLGVEHLVLAGVATHNCVAHTGADAFAENFRASYALGSIGSTNARYADAMLEILSAEYRQPIIDQDTALMLLS